MRVYPLLLLAWAGYRIYNGYNTPLEIISMLVIIGLLKFLAAKVMSWNGVNATSETRDVVEETVEETIGESVGAVMGVALGMEAGEAGFEVGEAVGEAVGKVVADAVGEVPSGATHQHRSAFQPYKLVNGLYSRRILLAGYNSGVTGISAVEV